ncbi:MAG: hypothetical protein WBH31_02120 [Promethearchaeia archaeon]
MAHTVLEEKENVYSVKNEGIILGDLLISEREVDLAYLDEADSKKLEDFSNYAKNHEELIDVNKVKHTIAFRNLGVY